MAAAATICKAGAKVVWDSGGNKIWELTGGAAISGAVGNEAHSRLKAAIAARVRRTRSLSENHRLARALRKAQLGATDLALHRYRRKPEQNPHRAFLDGAEAGLRKALAEVADLKWGDEVQTAWMASFEEAFESFGKANPDAEMTDAARACSAAAWAELVSWAGAAVAPERLRLAFLGDQPGRTPWFEAFKSGVLDALVEDEDFRSVFTAGKLVEISGVAVESRDILLALQAQSATAAADLAALRRDVATQAQSHTGVGEAIAEIGRTLGALERELVRDLDLTVGYAALPPDRARRLPTALVVADYGVIPYDDAEGGRAELLAWASSAGEGDVGGRLVVAPGGHGKTRLALELVEALRGQGWAAGVLGRAALVSRDARGEADADVRLRRFFEAQGPAGAFLVLDYAETRVEDVERVARMALACSPGKPVRLLLLARHAGEWWDTLRYESRDVELIFEAAPHSRLQAALRPERREAFFSRAAAAFAAGLAEAERADEPLLDPSWAARPAPQGRLSSHAAATPLALAFEAFLHVRGIAATQPPTVEMAREERRHWGRALGATASDIARDNDPRIDGVARCAAALTLINGAAADTLAESDQALDAILGAALSGWSAGEGDELARARRLGEVRAGVAKLYRDQPAHGYALRPILPDLLGECCVGLLGPERCLSVAFALADRRIEGGFDNVAQVLDRATRPVHSAPVRDAARHSLLSLATERFSDVGSSLIETARTQDGDTFALLQAAIDSFDPDGLGYFVALCGRSSTRLTELGFHAAQRRSGIEKDLRGAPDALREAARKEGTNRLRDQARETLEKGGNNGPDLLYYFLRRDLTAAQNLTAGGRTDLAEFHLAGVHDVITDEKILSQLRPTHQISVLQSTGIAAMDHGVLWLADHMLYKAMTRLMGLRPRFDAAEYHLLMLSTAAGMAKCLRCQGREGESLNLLEQIHRVFGAPSPHPTAELLHALAAHEHEYSETLAVAGLGEDALARAKRAVELVEAIVDEDPDARRVRLAGLVDNVGIRHGELQQYDEARRAHYRALELREDLARIAPKTGKADLSITLHNLGSLELQAGRKEEAEAHLLRALAIRRELVADGETGYLIQLGETVSSLAVLQFSKQDMVRLAESAAELRRIGKALEGIAGMEAARLIAGAWMFDVAVAEFRDDVRGVLDAGIRGLTYIRGLLEPTVKIQHLEQILGRQVAQAVVAARKVGIPVDLPDWLAQVLQPPRPPESKGPPPSATGAAFAQLQKSMQRLQTTQAKEDEIAFDEALRALELTLEHAGDDPQAAQMRQFIAQLKTTTQEASELRAYEDEIGDAWTPARLEAHQLMFAIVAAATGDGRLQERLRDANVKSRELSRVLASHGEELDPIRRILSQVGAWGSKMGLAPEFQLPLEMAVVPSRMPAQASSTSPDRARLFSTGAATYVVRKIKITFRI